MPLRILDIGKQFRPKTSIVYPPFKNGRYMEEYFYDYSTNPENNDKINGQDYVYIPAFWTNIQNHPNFSNMKDSLNVLLKRATQLLPNSTNYFTVVQADLGVELVLPKNTLVFGACYGDIPLPLIYEDTTNRLLNEPQLQQRKILGSFVGTYTHPLRQKIFLSVGRNSNFKFQTTDTWTNSVSQPQADAFIKTTLNSKFCLAPRGFGRSSFRFFEAIQLDTIPVYFWDDIEWLPYKDILDYSKFSVSIHESDINKTAEILKSISNDKYASMLEELKRVRHYFTLEGMSEYIIGKLKQ